MTDEGLQALEATSQRVEAAPVIEQQKTADQSSEMREMRNTFLGSGHAEEKLQQSVHDDEHPRRHWNRREQQHDSVAWKVDGVGEQQSEHATGSADRRIHRTRQRRDRELSDRGGDDADEVIDEITPSAEDLLDRAAEHPQRKHVESDMHQIAVQEGIRHQLPRLEAHLDTADLRRAERPEREENLEARRGLL